MTLNQVKKLKIQNRIVFTLILRQHMKGEILASPRTASELSRMG